MSISEARSKWPLPRKRNFLDPTLKPKEEDNSIILEQGKILLNSAGVSTILNDLVQTIKLEYPDAEVRAPAVIGCYGVEVQVQWDFRREEPFPENTIVHNFILVTALPLTNELEIRGKRREVLTRDQWNGHPEIVEDAVIGAYINNFLMGSSIDDRL